MAGNVTGSIGSNDVLLKNMATEDSLQEIVKLLEKDKGITETVMESLKTSLSTKYFGSFGANLSKLSNGLKIVGDATADAFSATTRIVRNLDSNINDTSYAFSALSRGGGALGAVFEFTANSVRQMQQQFDSYSKMMAVGGANVSSFEDLRVAAAEFGLTLDGLARLVTEDARNLKTGFSTVTEGALSLKKYTMSLRDTSKEYAFQLMQMGVDLNNMAPYISLVTQSMGGLATVVNATGNNEAKFNQKIIDATRSITALSIATGANRDLILKQMAEANKSPMYQQMAKQFNAAERMLQQTLMAAGLGAEDAIEVVLASTGKIITESAGKTMAFLGAGGALQPLQQFLAKFKDMGNTAELTDAQIIDLMQSLKEGTKGMSRDMMATLGFADKNLAPMINMLLDLNRTGQEFDVAKFREAMKRSTEVPKAPDDPMKAFAITKDKMIDLAISTAVLNSVINKFGINLAAVGSELAAQYGGAASRDMAKKLSAINFTEEVANIRKEIENHFKESRDNTPVVSPLRTPNPNQAPNVQANLPSDLTIPSASTVVPIINNGQRTTTPSPEGTLGGQGTRPEAITAARTLAQNIKNFSGVITGIKHDAGPELSAHKGGLGFDFALVEETEQAYEQAYSNVMEIMKRAGLSSTDYSLSKHKANQDGQGSPAHLHLHFNSENALKQFQKGATGGFKLNGAPGQQTSSLPNPGTVAKLQNGGTETDFGTGERIPGTTMAQISGRSPNNALNTTQESGINFNNLLIAGLDNLSGQMTTLIGVNKEQSQKIDSMRVAYEQNA